jgi:hypothetical protein
LRKRGISETTSWEKKRGEAQNWASVFQAGKLGLEFQSESKRSWAASTPQLICLNPD